MSKGRRLESDLSLRLPSSGKGHPGSPLSPREIQVLTLIAQGKGNKEVGHCLGISHNTVKNHMTTILIKLCAWNAAHAVYLYFVKANQQGVFRDPS